MIDAYSLEAFARDLDMIVQQAGSDYWRLMSTAKPAFERLTADMSWLPAMYAEPAESGHIQYLLREHVEGAFAIASVVFSPGFSTPVHDHGIWGLVSVWRGEEHEERFKRGPHSWKLRPAGTVINGPGSLSHLVPPDDDIHRVGNQSAAPACSIHVYGCGFHRRKYDLETGAVTDWPRGELKVLEDFKRSTP